jgi:N-acetylglutamate synthase-like GNAT family acetyltransferase
VVSEYFVAVSGGQTVGCAGVRRRNGTGYLYGLAVDKPWRKQGIGHALTGARLDWLREQRAQLVYVLAMFWNVPFFRKHGFTVADKKSAPDLKWLHNDFSDSWSKRSTLLSIAPLTVH